MNAEIVGRGLSRIVSKHIDWHLLEDSLGLRTVATRTASDGAKAQDTMDDAYRDAVHAAFKAAAAEFEKALAWLRRTMRLVAVLVLLAMAVSIGGAALLLISPYFAIVSVGGLVTTVGALRTAWQLARDEAMLELVPARYELALKLSASKADAQRLLDAFLAETRSLHQT